VTQLDVRGAALSNESGVSPFVIAVYKRLSDDPKQLRVDMPEQTRRINEIIEDVAREVAPREVIVREFKDDDRSAFKRKVKRIEFDELAGELEANRLDMLVSYDQDRYARRVYSWSYILELAHETETRIRFYLGGELNVQDAGARMQSHFKAATDEYSSAHNAERIRESLITLAEEGKQVGRVPFGWKRVHDFGTSGRALGYHDVKEPKEARVVRDIIKRVNAGDSLTSIARDLNKRGINHRTGRAFTPVTVRQIIMRPMNAGLLYRKGEYFGASQAPALVSERDWRAAVAKVSAPERRVTPGPTPQHLLSGIASCAVCGKPVRFKRANGIPAYQCDHVSHKEAPTDVYVRDAIVARLSMSDAAPIFATELDMATDALAELSELRDELRALEDRATKMTQAGYERNWDRIQSGIKDATARLERAGDAKLALVAELYGEDAGARFDALSLERKRAAIRLLCKIKLHKLGKGNRYVGPTAETVEIVFI